MFGRKHSEEVILRSLRDAVSWCVHFCVANLYRLYIEHDET